MAFPEWNEEHIQLREMVKDFAERELAPHRFEWDKAGCFPREVFTQLAELGLLGIRFEEEYGITKLLSFFSSFLDNPFDQGIAITSSRPSKTFVVAGVKLNASMQEAGFGQ